MILILSMIGNRMKSPFFLLPLISLLELIARQSLKILKQ